MTRPGEPIISRAIFMLTKYLTLYLVVFVKGLAEGSSFESINYSLGLASFIQFADICLIFGFSLPNTICIRGLLISVSI